MRERGHPGSSPKLLSGARVLAADRGAFDYAQDDNFIWGDRFYWDIEYKEYE
jgi:hypothetical protein